MTDFSLMVDYLLRDRSVEVLAEESRTVHARLQEYVYKRNEAILSYASIGRIKYIFDKVIVKEKLNELRNNAITPCKEQR